MRNLIFLVSEVQCNFAMNFLIQLKRNAIAERHFRTTLKRNLTYATEISQHNATTAFFAILESKRVSNLINKPNIYECYDQNGAQLSSMYRIALLTEKRIKSATNFKCFTPQRNFCNVSK